MVGLGAFVTTIAQPALIGRLPLQLLLKNQLHFHAQTLATFMIVATFAWNVKPLAGIMSDAFPLFGTRRRHYMLLGAGMAAVCWFLMGVVPRSYVPLLLTAFGANAFMVIASTVMGGLMVEAGQKYGISGRVTSIRQALQSAVSLGNGILGGYLAAAAFGWTVGIATALLLALVITTFFALTEQPVAVRNQNVLTNASHELATLIRSRTLWTSGIFLALVYISPGFTTPLLFLQTDTLNFSAPYIGLMESIEGAAGLLGALLYGIVCRRFNLRQLLTTAIALNVTVTLLYLWYSHTTPPGCESLGFALMMSARNFALGGSDLIGSWLIDSHHWVFHELVWLNAGTTALVLLFIPFLPRAVMSRKDGDVAPGPAGGPPAEPAPARAV